MTARPPYADARLDHLVLATPDLDRTVADVAEATGVPPAEGGRHLGHGTRNFLYGLGGGALGDGAYLEIVGPDPEQPAPRGPRWFGIDALTSARLVNWAVRVDGIAERVAYARTQGHDPGEPVSMSRRTPEGALLGWQLTYPQPRGRSGFDGLLPFLLDWGTSTHPTQRGLPPLPLLSFEAGHPDPDAVRAGLDALRAGAVAPRITAAPQPYLRAVVEGRRGRVSFGRGVLPS
ncbi:VOC family protein [Streptomyces cavernicola]|uniref:VOC family protein n=1 Tax=Streptomyces cavernicola TaxID=3043613 RepID=A0ABT6S9R9_9ACTN|nr:VOC family protein [Streptomyces sp. B-S-A6]MDI3404896.1 VOC family protein [Streptomyces sp. B-S-A6]